MRIPVFGRKHPKPVRQLDASDCGPACLHYVARHHNVRTSIARIRMLAGRSGDGVNIAGLMKAANSIGLLAKAIKAPSQSQAARSLPLPCIVHFILEDRRAHFVILHKTAKDGVEIMDPASGRFVRMEEAEFLAKWSGVTVILASRREVAAREGQHLTKGARLLGLVRPHSRVLLQALIGGVVATLLGLSLSIYVRIVVDDVITTGNVKLLNLLTILVIFIFCGKGILTYIQSRIATRTAQKIDTALILGFYHHLLQLPQGFFDSVRVGELLSRINDAVKIRTFLNEVALNLVSNVLIVTGSIGLMFLYSTSLAWITVAVLPVYACLGAISGKITAMRQVQSMKRTAEFTSELNSSLHSIGTIKRLRVEWLFGLKVENRLVAIQKLQYAISRVTRLVTTFSSWVSQVFIVVFLWRGVYLVIRQELTPGELMSCYALLNFLTSPLNSLLSSGSAIQQAFFAADRLFDVYSLGIEKDNGSIALDAGRPVPIELSNVAFSYPGRGSVLQNVSLAFNPGQLTVLAGESGSGKSTVLSLIQRIYVPSSGNITVGENDIRNLSLESLRHSIGSVPQRIDLFPGTLLENIALADVYPDEARAVAICNRLGLDGLIRSLPNGLHSRVTEDGSNFSGGQRQRIAIARVLYRNPRVIIMDEPSSALDAATEALLLEILKAECRLNKTVIIASHNGSITQAADVCYTFNDGHVVESTGNRSLSSFSRHIEFQAG